MNSARHGAAYEEDGVGGTTKEGAIGSTTPPPAGATAGAGASACGACGCGGGWGERGEIDT